MPVLTEEMREIMEAQDQQKAEYQELAGKIMVFARDQIMVSMRFLDRALFRMPMVPADTVATYGVNGQVIYYNTDHVLRSYKEEKNRCTRAFLHMIFHCIFSHPFQYEKMDRECWDLACDIAVEKTILDLKLADTRLASDGKQERVLHRLEEQLASDGKQERVLHRQEEQLVSDEKRERVLHGLEGQLASDGRQEFVKRKPEGQLASDERQECVKRKPEERLTSDGNQERAIWKPGEQRPVLTAERLYRFFCGQPFRGAGIHGTGRIV